MLPASNPTRAASRRALTAVACAVRIRARRGLVAMERCVDMLRCSLSARAGVRLGLLFGSHARGRARTDSDLDLAVELDAEVDPLRLAAELSAEVGREVDLVVLGAADLGYPLLKALVDHGRVLYEGRPGRAAAWRAQALTVLETDGPWFGRMRERWLARLRNEVRHG